MDQLSSTNAPGRRYDVIVFFALACAITWLADLPLVVAWVKHVTPPSYAMPLVALGAFGPTLAAVIVAGRRRELRSVFGRWRTRPLWVLVALLTPAAVNLCATLLDVVLGGHPAQWFYPPSAPEHIAALVFFSLGEEFGWRGFAYPRLADRHGPAIGGLLVGAVWGLWHLGMKFTPDGSLDVAAFLVMIVYLSAVGVIAAWLMERGARSMAVALALHAGGHLDNPFRAPDMEPRQMVIRLVVVTIAAALAARALARKPRTGQAMAQSAFPT